MLARLGERIASFFRATAPDPFVIAVLLSVFTFALVLVATDASPAQVVTSWSSDAGVWAFLKFSMQMCLILVTGHALASSPPVARAICALAGRPRTPAQAAALVAAVAATLGVLNWGLGLIGGALIAREVGRAMSAKGVRAHYPLLAASGYVGLLVWHGGFSGSAPISMTTTAQIAATFGASEGYQPIALDRTLLSPRNLLATGGLLLLAPLVMALMTPKEGAPIAPIESFAPRVSDPPDQNSPPGERKPTIPRLLEDTPLVTLLLVALIAWWAQGFYFPTGAGARSGLYSLTPNEVNLTMLMLGLVLHGTPARYVAAVSEAARGCAGIILQFPLYAGVIGMMQTRAAPDALNLVERIAGGMASLGGETTLPLLTFASAGVVNFFVPSGGGQWGVQGPIAIQAARDAGIDPAKMVMAVAYGDQLTNMLQPFWALPLLAVTGVKARDIVGYTAVLMVIAALWLALCLVVF